MKKSDLKNGMIVEFRDKSRGLVHNKRILDKEEFLFISNLNDDLTNVLDIKHLDIMKIFNSNPTSLENLFDDNELELIWERKEEPILSEDDKNIIKNGLKKLQEYCKQHNCDNCELAINDTCIIDYYNILHKDLDNYI